MHNSVIFMHDPLPLVSQFIIYKVLMIFYSICYFACGFGYYVSWIQVVVDFTAIMVSSVLLYICSTYPSVSRSCMVNLNKWFCCTCYINSLCSVSAIFLLFIHRPTLLVSFDFFVLELVGYHRLIFVSLFLFCLSLYKLGSMRLFWMICLCPSTAVSMSEEREDRKSCMWAILFV